MVLQLPFVWLQYFLAVQLHEWVPAWMRWIESGLGDVESNCPIEAVPMLDEAIQAFLFQRLTFLTALKSCSLFDCRRAMKAAAVPLGCPVS
ncbi:hypothetical protein EDD86DRAFT_205408, partial [Gorgonomyces haynaldii]